jgi:uncharacterized protein (TIGR03083 family)
MMRTRRPVVSEQVHEQLVAAHEAVFEGVLQATADLDERGWATPTGCPGWDVHDQLAHVVAVERFMLGDTPQLVEVPELDHVDDEFSRLVEIGVHARRGMDGEALRAEARETFDRRLAMLRALRPQVLAEEMDGPGGMRMKGSQMLRTRVFDMLSHEQDIRRALGRDVPLDGPAGQIAQEQILRAWAKLLPRQLEERGVLAVEATGPLATTRRIALDLTDPDAVEPRTVLRGSGAQLLALGCGRTDAPGLDELEVEGDVALARAVVAHASVTP